ncbi:MAG: OmpA family protein [Polyangiaceae bacterium]|nr:OmpA family protein [Polyangiaceae bacterium]
MRSLRTFLLLFALSSHAAAEPSASAFRAERLALRVEAGVGSMLSDHQREKLRYSDLAMQGTVRLGYALVPLLTPQVSFAYWRFPSERGEGFVASTTAGLRVSPPAGKLGRLFVDGNLGYSRTGEDNRLGADIGTGLEIEVHRSVALGPVARLGWVAQPDSKPGPSDALFWSFGLGAAFRLAPPAAPAPAPAASVEDPDRDGDGIADRVDACPELPGEKSDDPKKNGCPPDKDGDGIVDRVDACPLEPGEKSDDPKKNGCPPDRDGDGIADREDACPAVVGMKNEDPRKNGCPPDRDGDGIADAEDACPQTPGVKDADPKKNGCPPDKDGDGIPDERDRCPSEPETYNGIEDDDGCPEKKQKTLATLEGEQIRITQQVNFKLDKAEIEGKSSFQILDAVSAVLKNHPEIREVEVQGHTDDKGDAGYNLELSQRRAEAVREAMIQRGVAPERLKATGFGKKAPLVPNTSAANRARNRRVEFHLR